MLYQPRIKDDHIRKLYRLGKSKGRKMTHIVNEAISQYLEKETENGRNDDSLRRN
jgi:predicted transcriptional regulator